MEKEEFDFFDLEGDEFWDYVGTYLFKVTKNNPKYTKISKEAETLMSMHPKLRDISDEGVPNELTTQECANLIRVLSLKNDLNLMDQKEMFFLGAREAYTYFKNIGIITK